MKKDKISAQDIIDSLVAKTDISKQQADDFFKTFISTIETALLANDFVKVKNLGTFKLQWVAPRKSVNVQTGEDIEIEGHYKVVFTPEKELKEEVNKPFAHLESVVLDGGTPADKQKEEPNPMASLAEQAGSIKSLLTEIQEMGSDETTELPAPIEEVPAAAVVEKNPVAEEKPKAEKKPVAEVKKAVVEKKQETIHHHHHYQEEKKNKTIWWILLGILLVIGVLLALYFIPPQNNSFQHWVNKHVFGYDTAEYDAIRARARDRIKQAKSADFQQEQLKQEEPQVVQDDFSRAFDDRHNNREILATVRMNTGNRLTHLAQVHYGSPHFWVYIYEANREIISNPNLIPIGTTIRIPKMNPLLVDPTSSRAIEQALELHNKYLK